MMIATQTRQTVMKQARRLHHHRRPMEELVFRDTLPLLVPDRRRRRRRLLRATEAAEFPTPPRSIRRSTVAPKTTRSEHASSPPPSVQHQLAFWTVANTRLYPHHVAIVSLMHRSCGWSWEISSPPVEPVHLPSLLVASHLKQPPVLFCLCRAIVLACFVLSFLMVWWVNEPACVCVPFGPVQPSSDFPHARWLRLEHRRDAGRGTSGWYVPFPTRAG